MMRIESASSVGPPNIIVPRQSGETFTPAFPKTAILHGVCSLG